MEDYLPIHKSFDTLGLKQRKTSRKPSNPPKISVISEAEPNFTNVYKSTNIPKNIVRPQTKNRRVAPKMSSKKTQFPHQAAQLKVCLLYTSDAADE